MKKLFSIISALCCACAIMAGNVITYTAPAKLTETTNFSGLHTNAFNVSISSHTFSNGTGTITFAGDVTSIGNYAFRGCTGLTSISIPNSVTTIGSYAFSSCTGLTSISIPNSVTSIGNDAFYGCSGLTSITIPNSVTSIGDYTFWDCSGLTSVTIGNSVTSIGENAFQGCTGLTSITIGNSVTSIGNYAFRGCSGLTSVTIPNSVTTIGNYAFYYCSGLTSINVDSDNTTYDSRENCNAIIETTTNTLVAGCVNTVIPNSVTSIGNFAFYGCSGLISITIPNSVTTIGEYAFYGCTGLTSISIPNSVTSIGLWAFSDCRSLTSITVEATTPPSLGSAVFSDFSIPLYVPCGTAEAYRNASGWSSFTTIEEPNAPSFFFIADNGQVVFIQEPSCSDSTVVFKAEPDFGYQFTRWTDGNTDNPRTITLTQDTTLTALFEMMYSGSCGENLTWSYADGVLTISGTGAMDDYSSNTVPWLLFRDSITSVVLNNGITHIGDYAFSGIRGLRTLDCPNSLISIGNYSFQGCNYLTTVTFNANLVSIGNYAFAGCTRVSSMTCLSEVTPEVGTGALADISSYAYLYVLAGYKHTYLIDTNWNRFDIHELGASSDGTGGGAGSGVTVTPGDNDANFTWPTENNADTYTLVITKEGETFCTLTFSTDGRLLGIAFAPGRDGTLPNVRRATLAGNKMSFRVTGLDYATLYGYSLNVEDNAAQMLRGYRGSFATTGFSGTIPTPERYAITLECNASQGSVSGPADAEYGESVSITATPAEGYHFTRWSDGNTDNPRVVMIIDNCTYIAEFEINRYLLTLTVNDANMGYVTGAGTYEHNESVSCTAVPLEGYEFVKWSNGMTNNPMTFVMTEDTSIQAEFRKIPSALDDVEAESKVQKFFRDGHFYILRDGQLFDATGRRVE